MSEVTMETVPCIRPYFDIGEEERQRIVHLLDSGYVTNNGPYVREFESKLAEHLGTRETAVVSSGSEALLLALTALDLSPGKVILPAYTYVATLNAVVQAGFEAVFCDIHPDTYVMHPDHLAEILQTHPDVRCVIPVNVYGIPPNLPTIRSLCDSASIPLIFDNAHGFGTEIAGEKMPGEPDIQCFSFHATKTLPAIEGGMVIADDPTVLATVKQLRNHGLPPKPTDHYRPGFNAKLDEIRAVIGISALEHFPETLARRRTYGQRLVEAFKRFPDDYATQAVPRDVNTNFQNIGVRCLAAAQIGLTRTIDAFVTNGVCVRSYFSPPLYKFRGFDSGPTLPVTESVWKTLVSVPIHSRMTEEELHQIEEAAARVARTC